MSSDFWDKPNLDREITTKPFEQVLEDYATEHPNLDLSDKMKWWTGESKLRSKQREPSNDDWYKERYY